jgi:hypothetical protein
VIFFPLTIDGLVEQFGHVEAIDDPFGVLQQLRTRFVVGRSHIDTVSLYLLPLRRRQFFQTFPTGCFVPTGRHGQHLRLLGIRQIGEDRHIQLVAFFYNELNEG